MPHLESWTNVHPRELATVFDTEAARWHLRLGWDTTALWPGLDRARLAGDLPGFVLRDDAGALIGWTYAAERDGELHCGALSARDDAATAQLVDAVLALPEALAASRIVVFAYTDAPGVEAALARRGFQLDPHAYMSQELVRRSRARGPGRTWDVRDLDATADLLGTSYPALDHGRPFAPHGGIAEWRQYVADLVMGQGCGRFRPSLSIAVPGSRSTLDAVALVTDLGPGTAHLAQLAVRPGLRGAGLGGEMLSWIADAAAAARYERLTLLVGARNVAARRLYHRAGFAAQAGFVSATRVGEHRSARCDPSAA